MSAQCKKVVDRAIQLVTDSAEIFMCIFALKTFKCSMYIEAINIVGFGRLTIQYLTVVTQLSNSGKRNKTNQ